MNATALKTFSLLLALLALTSCRSGAHHADSKRATAIRATKESAQQDEPYDMGLKVDRAIMEMLSDRFAQVDVLRNAAMLYRQQNGRWPSGKEDVARYVFNVDRYDSITFTPSPDNGVMVEWVLEGSHGSGKFTIPPRNARQATTAPSTRSSG